MVSEASKISVLETRISVGEYLQTRKIANFHIFRVEKCVLKTTAFLDAIDIFLGQESRDEPDCQDSREISGSYGQF